MTVASSFFAGGDRTAQRCAKTDINLMPSRLIRRVVTFSETSLLCSSRNDRRTFRVAPFEERSVIHHHVVAEIFKREICVRRLAAGSTVSQYCPTIQRASLFIEFA